jgi:hypothetical protein
MEFSGVPPVDQKGEGKVSEMADHYTLNSLAEEK